MVTIQAGSKGVLHWNNVIPQVYTYRITTTSRKLSVSVSFYIFPNYYMDTFQALNCNQLDPRYKAVTMPKKTFRDPAKWWA